ncbi:MAG: integrase [Bacteroidia bacterium]
MFKLLKDVRSLHPQIKDLYHIRASVIFHWVKEKGLMEAMIMAGHLNIGSTKRYDTKQYDKLQELLKAVHPMERLNLTA